MYMSNNITDPNLNVNKAVAPALDGQGRINVDTVKSVHIDHAGAANMVLKHIHVVPNLSVESRMIMTIKVMNPGIKNKYIARQMKMSEYDVRMYEKEGVNRCAAYVRQLTLEDSMKKFNMDKLNSTDEIMKTNITPSNPLIYGADQPGGHNA